MSKPSLRYKPAASETEEGKKRIAEYWIALGRFVDMFSKAEMAVAFTLWNYAKTPNPVSRAVFSGFNIDAAMNTIKRIAEATNASDQIRNEIKWLFDQLGTIRGARNDILHYGAINVPEGSPIVTNALKALVEGRITHFPVTPTILDHMTADLRKIIIHLHLDHMGRPPLSLETLKMFDETRRDSWRYKHPPQQKSQTKKAESPQSRKRGPKLPRQPQP